MNIFFLVVYEAGARIFERMWGLIPPQRKQHALLWWCDKANAFVLAPIIATTERL